MIDTTSFWKGKNVLVTGGAGFIGSHVVDRIVAHGGHVRVPVHSPQKGLRNLEEVRSRLDVQEGDLCEIEFARMLCRDMDIVLHLAAHVGSVQHNLAHPASIYRDNALMDLNILESARLAKVERMVVTSSASVYPHTCTIPTPETEGFLGEPPPTNRGYGWAKRMLELQAQLFAQEFGMKIGIVRPYNAYGPRDHFGEENAHIIPSLIHRLHQASGESLLVWGSGKQTRAFLYADDFARGIMLCAERYAVADPVNLGTDQETTIHDLAHLLVRLSGRAVKPFFDTHKTDGQPRRNSDNRKAKEKLGFEASIPLEVGLLRTLEWYKAHILSVAA